MAGWLVGSFLALVALGVIALGRAGIKAGPATVDADTLERARVLMLRTDDEPGPGWDLTGSATQARGLNLRFEHDDDPQAEAAMLAPGRSGRGRNVLTNVRTIRLRAEFEDHQVHTSGYVFRVRLRGTGSVVGKKCGSGCWWTARAPRTQPASRTTTTTTRRWGTGSR